MEAAAGETTTEFRFDRPSSASVHLRRIRLLAVALNPRMTLDGSTSLTVKCSSRLSRQHETPICRDFWDRKADARIRTADPFITSDQVSVERSLQIGFYRRSPPA
jgi:hypothetical protein